MAKALKSTVLVVLIAIMAFSFVGCLTNEHIVGTGAQTGYTESAKQWYLIYGLVPLNTVDTKAMSGGSENYKIVTQMGVLDAIVNVLTGGIVSARTVEVVK
ncbi:MAG: Bor/Iss family lipoprotein [Spirochaetales bacterium]